MELLYKNELEKALNSEKPIENLRNVALELNKTGFKRQEIYDIFYTLHLFYQDTNMDFEADVLGDVMDMITGYYVPFTLDLE